MATPSQNDRHDRGTPAPGFSAHQISQVSVTAGRATLQLLATVVMTLTILQLQPANHLCYIWPLTGIQLAIAWEKWPCRHYRFAQLSAAVAGYIVACLWIGWSPLLAVELGILQGAELWVTMGILRPKISGFADLKQQKLVRLFGIVSVTVPLGMASLRAMVFHQAIHSSFLHAWAITGMSHTVGLLVVAPALLLLGSMGNAQPATWRNWRFGLAAQLLVLMVTSYTFSQTTYPFLFLVLPPVVLGVLVGGMEGAVISSLTVTLISCWATSSHHGPVWLLPQSSPETRTTILQLFLAMVVGTALPVGALLDEREAADKEIRKGQAIYHTLLDHSQDMIPSLLT